jgi:hypothetical protein
MTLQEEAVVEVEEEVEEEVGEGIRTQTNQ